MDEQSLAELSNSLIYSSMLVLFFSMLAFAVSFAGRKSRSVDLRATERSKKLQTVGAGRGGSSPDVATPSNEPGCNPGLPDGAGLDADPEGGSRSELGDNRGLRAGTDLTTGSGSGRDTRAPGAEEFKTYADGGSPSELPGNRELPSGPDLDNGSEFGLVYDDFSVEDVVSHRLSSGQLRGHEAGCDSPTSVGDGAAVARRAARGDSEGASGSSADRAVVEPGRRAGNIAIALSWLGFALLLGAVVARGMWAGRAPWGNMYEFSLTSALAILGVFLAISIRKDIRWLGIFVLPVVLLTLGLSVTVLYSDAAQLVPALQSYWLVIHVSTAILCGGAFMVAAAVAALFLASQRATRPPKGAISKAVCAIGSRLPEPGRLDRLSYRLIAFSFPLWTFAVVAGAIWAESAWGRYWGWDPKETWAFITWVVYAGYLHARTTAGWKGRRAAIIAIVGFAVYVFNYFGVNLFIPGLHSYSGV